MLQGIRRSLSAAQCGSGEAELCFLPFLRLFSSPPLIPLPPPHPPQLFFHSLASFCAAPSFSHGPPRHLAPLFLFLSSPAALLPLLHLLDRRRAEPKAERAWLRASFQCRFLYFDGVTLTWKVFRWELRVNRKFFFKLPPLCRRRRSVCASLLTSAQALVNRRQGGGRETKNEWMLV